MYHLVRGFFNVSQAHAFEQARPEQVLAVHEREVRQLRSYFLAHEQRDLVVRLIAIHHATYPHVHRPVRVVQAFPNPRVEIRVVDVEVVVGLAIRPRVFLFHPHAAHISHPAGQVPAI